MPADFIHDYVVGKGLISEGNQVHKIRDCMLKAHEVARERKEK